MGDEKYLEVLRTLPVKEIYEDAAKEPAKELGVSLTDLLKAFHLIVLGPVQYLAAQQDRYKRFLDKTYRKVPEKKRVCVHPQIAGPVLEGYRYIEEESLLAEFFSNLLARALNKDDVGQAHPAFANLILQLSPDETTIIFGLKKRCFKVRQHSAYDHTTNTFSPRTLVSNEFAIDTLTIPENFFMYVDHLYQLGLGGIWQDGNQEVIRDGDRQTGVYINSIFQLTEFGRLFSTACVPDDFGM